MSDRISSRIPQLRFTFAVAVLGLISQFSNPAQATILYATSVTNSLIDRVDMSTNTVTTYLNTPSDADSIMFDSAGRLIYTELYTTNVDRYDPSTLTNTVIASGLNNPADIVMEPGGNSMLVSEFYGAKIDRIDLNTNLLTTLPVPGIAVGGPEGLAYDGSRLFANLGVRSGGPTGKYLAEINPVTGAIIAQSPGLNSLDGLTYDPYSGMLFASSLLGNLVYEIDPNNLSNVSILGGSRPVTILGPDGITTDGLGNIFVASSSSDGDSHIYQFNLPSNTLTQGPMVVGLDDLAPASGPGSAVPEPACLSLVAMGAFLLRRRRHGGCDRTHHGPRAQSPAAGKEI